MRRRVGRRPLGHRLRHAIVLAVLGLAVPQQVGVDALAHATPWTATTGDPSSVAYAGAWNSYATTAANDGSVAYYWRFNDNNSTLAATAGGINGQYINNPTYQQTSSQGGTDHAVYFNPSSSQYAQVNNNVGFAMNGTQAYSIEIVFKLQSLAATGNPRLVSKADHGSGTGGWEVAYNGSADANAGQVYCQRGPASGNGSQTIIGSAGLQLTAGQWVHMVCTFDGSTMKFYWNGALRATAAAGGNINNNTQNLLIGTYGGSDYANGYFDEVGLYWAALTDRQVRSHYYAFLAHL